IAPASEFRAPAEIFVPDIVSADPGLLSVHDENLAMVAVVDSSRAVDAQEVVPVVEGKDPYSRRPQPPDVAARQPEAADVVIQQKDFDAGMRALDQRIGESLPHFVVADDVELDVDVAFGARDAVEDRAEGRVSVD